MKYFLVGIVALLSYISFILYTKKVNIEDIAINIYIRLLYFYSFIQIQYSKYIKPYLKQLCIGNWKKTSVDLEEHNEDGEDDMMSKMLLIQDGEVITSRAYNLSKLDELYLNDGVEYDLLVFITHDNSNNTNNKETTRTRVPLYSIYKEVPAIVDGRKVTSYSFLTMELVIYIGEEQKKYEVDLNDGTRYNFYIVNNVLNASFWLFYVKQFLLLNDLKNINADNFKYKLTIIDDTADLIEVDETKSIVFNENKYLIE
jgi:hypothetical protein